MRTHQLRSLMDKHGLRMEPHTVQPNWLRPGASSTDFNRRIEAFAIDVAIEAMGFRRLPHLRLVPERKQLRWACIMPNTVAYFGSTPADAYRRAMS